MGEFPAGLKILIVDDDRTCLLVLETMLRKLLYEVTKCELARDALALLREDKNRFDIVICDLHMPDMDGFKLLEIIGLEMDLPVVMMSSDDGKGVVMKGIIHGACDYLVKPIRMEAIRLIWQHVVRKKKRILEEFQQPKNINVIDRSLLLQPAKDAVAEQMPGRDKGSFQNLKRVREDEKEDNDGESSDEVTTAKKPRVIWTQELHEMFVAAVNQLGRDKAVPKKILECMQAMNVTGLTRANIASHLQKYRMHLQKEGQVQPSTDNRDVNAFSEQASSIRLRNLQFQPTGSSCQLPLQHLITPQSWRSERANESLGAGPSHDQESNIYDPVVAESGHCDLPTDYFASHDLPRANLLYQNDCRLASGVAISNEEYLHRNVGNNLTELSKPFSAVDELIYEPLFLIGQYDQDDLFRGPFAKRF